MEKQFKGTKQRFTDIITIENMWEQLEDQLSPKNDSNDFSFFTRIALKFPKIGQKS